VLKAATRKFKRGNTEHETRMQSIIERQRKGEAMSRTSAVSRARLRNRRAGADKGKAMNISSDSSTHTAPQRAGRRISRGKPMNIANSPSANQLAKEVRAFAALSKREGRAKEAITESSHASGSALDGPAHKGRMNVEFLWTRTAEKVASEIR